MARGLLKRGSRGPILIRAGEEAGRNVMVSGESEATGVIKTTQSAGEVGRAHLPG